MPETTVKAMDPLGVVAIANVIQYLEKPEPIGCPNNCGCNPMCGCEDKPGCCEDKCGCEKKPQAEDIFSTLSNPVFREVVQGLDMSRVKNINDFLGIVGDIRAKVPSLSVTGRTTDK